MLIDLQVTIKSKDPDAMIIRKPAGRQSQTLIKKPETPAFRFSRNLCGSDPALIAWMVASTDRTGLVDDSVYARIGENSKQ